MNREELEDLWRKRLQDAHRSLDFAASYLDEVKRDDSLDGERAIRAHNAALAQYHRVLLTFTDLVMEGKLPNEAEWHRAAGG